MIALSACLDAGKPSSQVTNDQIKQDATAIPFIKANFKEVTVLSVISRPVQGKQCLVVANLTYDNGAALISGGLIINYEWSKQAWIVVNSQFNYKAAKVKYEASDQAILAAVQLPDKINTQFQFNTANPSQVIGSRSPDLTNGNATYIVNFYSVIEGWTGTFSSIVSAKYDYKTGWKFSVSDWTYSETMTWTGTWVIQWGTYGNETQYAPNEKMTLNITGDIRMIHNTADYESENRDVNVSFRRTGSPYSIPVILSQDNQQAGLYSTRFIQVKYGNQEKNRFTMEMRFNGNGSGMKTQYIAKSYDGNIGSLAKIK